jgi:hypothetical protein
MRGFGIMKPELDSKLFLCSPRGYPAGFDELVMMQSEVMSTRRSVAACSQLGMKAQRCNMSDPEVENEGHVDGAGQQKFRQNSAKSIRVQARSRREIRRAVVSSGRRGRRG